MTGKLSELRGEIDRVDRELLRLLSERGELVVQVAGHKRAEDLPLVDGHRERKILDEATGSNPGPLSDAAVAAVMREVVKHCRKLVLEPSSAERGAGKSKLATPRQVRVGRALFGGAPEFIAGPCAVENRDGLLAVARSLAEQGVKYSAAGLSSRGPSP